MVWFSGQGNQHYTKSKHWVFCGFIIISIIYMVLLNLSFLPAPSNMTDVGQHMTEPLHATWSVNKFSDGVWPTIWESVITATANLLCGLAVRLLLQLDKLFCYWLPHTIDYVDSVWSLYYLWSHWDLYTWWLWTMLCISWCTVSSGSNTWAVPVSIRIYHLKI